ncbi:MAG: 50S ribosomal protein L18 [Bacteroidetes bacterium]|nr:50S ribosomal protein L18 [Bacteroidota bacterium]
MPDKQLAKTEKRMRIKHRIRKRIHGTAVKPRLTVFRSLKHMYAQLVDDDQGSTLVTISSLSAAVREKKTSEGGKTSISKAVGLEIARVAKEKGIETVVFDRNGYQYHGRVKAIAEGAREGGLKF